VLYFSSGSEIVNRSTKDYESLSPPDKKIPLSIMLIGTFELAIALMGLIAVFLQGQLDINWVVFAILLTIYGAMGAGLWAIQEWARFANVVLHIVAIPYAIFTTIFLGGPAGWQTASQIVVASGIVFALTRPEIRLKFQTVVPKKRQK
jgi:hypothetical protein